MDILLNLSDFCQSLKNVTEQKAAAQEREVISPYILDELLPLLEQGTYPRLADIDFSQFDEDDPPALARYIEARERVSYDLENFNRSLCLAQPKSCKRRMFL